MQASSGQGAASGPRIHSFGAWESPIGAELLVEHGAISFPLVDGGDIYWMETRPDEGGRQTLMCRGADGRSDEILPAGYSARTLVHEYGGLPYAVSRGTVFFVNFADQRLYRLDRAGDPRPVTPAPATPSGLRYAVPTVTADGDWLVCVRENHLGDDVVNEIVAIDTAGSFDIRVLGSGRDFYSTPVLSPDGGHIAWTCWDHPNMPWDGTELYAADLRAGMQLGDVRLVAGGLEESVVQPRFSRDGTLHFISDRSGWWNIYRDDGDRGQLVAGVAAEFAVPDFMMGLSNYAFAPDDSLIASWASGGFGHLGRLDPSAGAFAELGIEGDEFAGLQGSNRGVVAVVASCTAEAALVEICLPEGNVDVICGSHESGVAPGYISVATPIEFETANGLTAYALYYKPVNPEFAGPAGALPPLIVTVHGGPTGASSPVLDHGIQYWTSRGIAVAAVNYRGSAGYGRAYRDAIHHGWGVVDLEDSVNVTKFLAASGEVDPAKLVIRGGSAGGYTTLCALTFRTEFAAGADYYGAGDLIALNKETHKFQSRYIDGLVGKWPDAEETYRERSPLFHVERLATPIIIFQGLEDKVVPPNQSEMMVAALRRNGTAFAYLGYEGEQHGFRRAENIIRNAEAELYFYGRILGFAPADAIEPVDIENLAIEAAGS